MRAINFAQFSDTFLTLTAVSCIPLDLGVSDLAIEATMFSLKESLEQKLHGSDDDDGVGKERKLKFSLETPKDQAEWMFALCGWILEGDKSAGDHSSVDFGLQSKGGHSTW